MAAADGAISDGVGPAVEVERREDVKRLQVALASLPAETRALLVQRHGMCMKLTEIAESFDCTERTVRNRLKRAAALLAEALIRGEGGSS
jgi:RNA polymerase sigma-70 factor (ECF subfamily)